MKRKGGEESSLVGSEKGKEMKRKGKEKEEGRAKCNLCYVLCLLLEKIETSR